MGGWLKENIKIWILSGPNLGKTLFSPWTFCYNTVKPTTAREKAPPATPVTIYFLCH